MLTLDSLDYLIGMTYTKELGDSIPALKKRIGPVGMIVTQDFVQSRLNIRYDENMVIKRAFWG